MFEDVQTYVAQVGNVLTGMIVCVVLLMYVVFMELRPAVKEMQSEKEGYTARLTTCADSGLGNNTTQCWGDDSLLRGGRDGFLGYSEPPVFYDVGDLAAIRKQQRSTANEMKNDPALAKALEEENKRREKVISKLDLEGLSDEERYQKISKALSDDFYKRITATGMEKFSRYEKIHEGMKSDEDLLAMQ